MSVKILAFSLIILDGISESWQAFNVSKFKISFKLSSSLMHLKVSINPSRPSAFPFKVEFDNSNNNSFQNNLFLEDL